MDGSLFFLGKLSRQWATKDTDPGVEKSHATDAHWRKPLATELDVNTFGYVAGTTDSDPGNIFEDFYHYRPIVYVTMPSQILEATTMKQLSRLSSHLKKDSIDPW